MTDYENKYRKCDCACGEPFPEFVEFFRAARKGLSVLDLGCGQGRDALMAARFGHVVRGVDIAGTGISQMVSTAKRERLRVIGETSDIERFETSDSFDVVILDRVLHMLETDEQRRSVLGKVAGWVAPGGHALLADTKRHRALIRDFFSILGWDATLKMKDFLFVRKPGSTVEHE